MKFIGFSKIPSYFMDKFRKNKEDSRILKTKWQLKEALFQLLETEPFEEISVLDVCKKAKVHRTTFYKHFTDKNALLFYSLDLTKEELISKLAAKDGESGEDFGDKIIDEVLDFVNENSAFMQSVVSTNSNDPLMFMFKNVLEKSIGDFLTMSSGESDYVIPLPLLCTYLSGGFISVMYWWLENTDVPVDTMKQYIKKLINVQNYKK